MIKFLRILLSGIFLTMFSGVSGAGDKLPRRADGAVDPAVVYAHRLLQGFNMRVWLSNQMAMGLQGWDGSFSYPPMIGLEYPAGSGLEHLYGAGALIGAKIGSVARVTEGYNTSTAGKEMLPFPGEHIWRTAAGSTAFDSLGYSGYYFNEGIVVNRARVDDDQDGSTDEDELDGFDNDGDWVGSLDDAGSDGLSDRYEVSCSGVPYDSLTNPDPAMDNYEPGEIDQCRLGPNGEFRLKNDRGLYTEGNGIPDHGEVHVDEDYAAISDNDLYYAATDSIPPAGSFPLKAKVWQRSYAWQTGSSADAIVPLEYTYVNLGADTWDSVYLGMVADMDVGPAATLTYYARNYSAYDALTRTAYVHNPVDSNATPVGVTVLTMPLPADSIRSVFQWWDFSQGRVQPVVDSVLYTWMNGDAFPDSMIWPDQDVSRLSDTRFLISYGPFGQALPGDTLKAAFALVSGETVGEMLKNAGKAQRIYAAGGFICPVARIFAPGNGSPDTISWDPVVSPFGAVTSYVVYYGNAPGAYTDSVVTTELLAPISGIPDTAGYYFSVLAIDDQGNRSALSDEISNLPRTPGGLVVTPGQRSVSLGWNGEVNPGLRGYNVYRTIDGDPIWTKLNILPLTDTVFADTAVWGNHTYRYRVTALALSGFETPPSQERNGWLIPPAVPAEFVIGRGSNYLYLDWAQNTETDFMGYYIRRILLGDTVVLGGGLVRSAGYKDTTVSAGVNYAYFVEAVDSTDAASRTQSLAAATHVPDQRILVINDVCPPAYSTEVRAFIEFLLSGYDYFVVSGGVISALGTSTTYFDPYSSVLWISECPDVWPYGPLTYPRGLKGYLLGGGQMLIMGRGMTPRAYPVLYRFLSTLFGITPFLEIDTVPDFMGAAGAAGGFPSVFVDPEKIVGMGGWPGKIERFGGSPPERVLYTYISDPVDTLREGKPVGLSAVGDDMKAYYFSFPLWFLDTSDASALLRRVLDDFGEVMVGVGGPEAGLPTEFRLYDAYPNPFNPSTTIRVDVPLKTRVVLSVYDLLGREVERLADEDLLPGRHEFRWDAAGRSSGTYYLRIRSGDRSASILQGSDTRKLLLMK